MDEHGLAEIAAQLAARVRDDDPQANARWLASVAPEPADWFRLTFVLAAAVPTDVPWSVLTGWVTSRDRTALARRPHGTAAAVRRHNYRHESLCDLCRIVERDRKRESYIPRLGKTPVDKVGANPVRADGDPPQRDRGSVKATNR